MKTLIACFTLLIAVPAIAQDYYTDERYNHPEGDTYFDTRPEQQDSFASEPRYQNRDRHPLTLDEPGLDGPLRSTEDWVIE